MKFRHMGEAEVKFNITKNLSPMDMLSKKQKSPCVQSVKVLVLDSSWLVGWQCKGNKWTFQKQGQKCI